MPARLPNDVVEDVERVSVANPSWTGKSVWEEVKRRNGHREVISLRMVYYILAKLKPPEPINNRVQPPVPWQPWEDESVPPMENAYLVLLDTVDRTVYKQTLFAHEAQWARRLMPGLDGLSPFLQLCFCKEYASRERWSRIKQVPISTRDLDGVLAYKPWIQCNREPYKNAVFNMYVPEPLFRRATFFESANIWQEVLLGLFTESLFVTVLGMEEEQASLVWLRENMELLTWAKENRE